MELKYFGKVSDLQEKFYEEKVLINSNKVHICLDLEDGIPDEDWLTGCASLLNNLEQLDTQLLKKLKEEEYSDAPDDSTVRFYVEHHIDELSDEDLLEVLGSIKDGVDLEDQLLDALHLDGLSIYEDFISWDYTINGQITDYLISVETDLSGEIQEVSMES